MSKPQFHIGIKNTVSADMGGGSTCELYFMDTIQDKEVFDWSSMSMTTESMLADVVNEVNRANPKKIIQYIDSWGGDADLGKGIYNFLKDHPAKVETKIINKAASAATCMSCAGSKITMPKTGMYVIHRASNAAQGTSDVLREAADVADRYTDAYCDIYAQNNRKGKTAEEIKALIADGDYWMTGEQAKEMGFVDDCYNDASVTVTANVEAARAIYGDNIPSCVTMLVEAETPQTFFTKIQNEMKSFKEMVTALLGEKKITAKVTDGEFDITAAITPLMAQLAAEMETEVTAEVGKIKDELTTSLTDSITASFEEKYGTVITAQKESIDKLTADLTAMAGKESRPGKVEVKADGKKVRPGLGNPME